MHILERMHGSDDGGFIDLAGQGELHQDAVDLRICIETLDQREQLLLSCFLR